jgi:hypothetical protein
MSRRLTHDIREKIATAALRHRFHEEIEVLAADRAALANDIYNDVYRKADREKIEALPAGWLPTVEYIDAKFGDVAGDYARIYFDGGFYGKFQSLRARASLSNRPARRALHKHYHGCWKVYDVGHKLAIRHADLAGREAALVADIRAAERQIEASLNSVSTVSALVKAWPEIEPFVKPLSPIASQVPALPTASLNEMLKLPVSEAA